MKPALALLALVAVGCSKAEETKPEPAAAPKPVVLHYYTLGTQ